MKDRKFMNNVKSALRGTVMALGTIAYLIVGLITGLWNPMWVILVCCAFFGEIVNGVIDLFDKEKIQADKEKGKNTYFKSAGKIVYALAMSAFIILGGVFGLWHPWWCLIVIALAIDEVLKHLGALFLK